MEHFPAYAAESDNPNVEQKIQNMNPNAYQEIKNTVEQIENNDPNVSTDLNDLNNSKI